MRLAQLTELLEIPQLLEACIHNELFDSALDVIQFANDTFQTDSNATATGGPVAPNVVIDCLVCPTFACTILPAMPWLTPVPFGLSMSRFARWPR